MKGAAVIAGLVLLAGSGVVACGQRPGPVEPQAEASVEERIEAPPAPALRAPQPRERTAPSQEADEPATPADSATAASDAKVEPASDAEDGPCPDDTWFRFDVQVVDAETGAPLPGGCAPKDVVRRWTDSMQQFEWGAAAPDGYVEWEPSHCWETVSRYATSALVRHPLRREAQVAVSVLEHDGTPAVGAILDIARVAHITCPAARLEPCGPAYVARGVPFLRGEPLSLSVVPAQQQEGFWPRSTEEQGVLPQRWSDVVAVSMRLPEPEPLSSTLFEGPSNNGMIGFSTGCGCGRRVRSGGQGSGRLAITGRRRDGSPAPRARVAIDGADSVRLDAAGKATVTLAPGGWTLRLREVGLVPCDKFPAVVVEDEVTDVTITEPDGATIEVDVVDVEGVARPFATVEIVQPSRLDWVDLRDGVQRLGSYVDEIGRRTFRHVEPGVVRLKATWARREVETSVEVREGETRRLRIVVPAAGT